MIESAKKIFNKLSIPNKIVLIVIPSTIIGLSIMFIAIIATEWLSMKTHIEKDISTQAIIIGSNSISAITLNHANAAKETLSSLFLYHPTL